MFINVWFSLGVGGYKILHSAWCALLSLLHVHGSESHEHSPVTHYFIRALFSNVEYLIIWGLNLEQTQDLMLSIISTEFSEV